MEHTEDKEKIPVYEGTLPNRYNPYGEWMPLSPISGLSLEDIGKKVKELPKNVSDQRIKGVAQYIVATNMSVIEFVVKSKFSLKYPDNGVTVNDCRFHLRKVDVISSKNNVHANLQVYDGTFELPFNASNIDCEAIAKGLYTIDIILNRLGFSFDSKVEWVLKYSYSDSAGGVQNISDDDYEAMKENLSTFRGEDGVVIDSSISWYLNAKKTDDVFIKYLNTFIALESLAFPLVDGELEVSSMYGFNNKIKYKKNKFFDKYISKVKKVVRAVFGDSNNKKMKLALSAIFGVDSERFKLFYKKSQKNNLYDIRSKIAHGRFTSIDREHQELVEKRIYDLMDITRDFILRILYKSQSNEKVKKITPSFNVSIMMADPRSCGLTTDMTMIKRGDWRIRLEWLF